MSGSAEIAAETASNFLLSIYFYYEAFRWSSIYFSQKLVNERNGKDIFSGEMAFVFYALAFKMMERKKKIELLFDVNFCFFHFIFD